jgi:predicted RNA polymerase sigma factor
MEGLRGFEQLYTERLNYSAAFLARLGRPRAAADMLRRALELPVTPATRRGLESNLERVESGSD